MLILTVTTDFVLKANPTTSACTYSAHWQLHSAPSLHHLACRRGDPRPKKRPLLGHQALVGFQILFTRCFQILGRFKASVCSHKTSNLCKDKMFSSSVLPMSHLLNTPYNAGLLAMFCFPMVYIIQKYWTEQSYTCAKTVAYNKRYKNPEVK